MIEAQGGSTVVESEYILGTDKLELDRLREQHQAWVEQAHSLIARGGLRSGDVVLDLGCGPGYTSIELARVVGPEGRVIARDVSPHFIRALESEVERLSLAGVEPSLGPVEELELPPEHLDSVYARWLLCWLPDPGAVLERITRSLKPGGTILLQDYLDWGAMKLVPPSEDHNQIVEICMRSWREGIGTIDIGEHIPSFAAECGLRVECFEPVARMGAPGSLVWGWLDGFYRSYLPRLIERGLLETRQMEAFMTDWERRSEDGEGFVYAPTVVDVVLRKP